VSQRPAKLVLIDGNSLLYRAFFALPPLTNAQGEMTNAVYGFTNMLFRLIEEERPDMVAVAFDRPEPTFRHEAFADYKATRPKTPDELISQIETAREVLEAMHIPICEAPGFEADDVIGTLASQAETAGHQVLVVTGDLDELQLVSGRVSVMVTRRGISDTKVYDVEAVKERYGFAPEHLPDFRALRGDPSDNIPGVPGIGEKTAAALIKRYSSLEEVLAHADEVTPPRIGAALQAHADLARQAKELSLISRDAPVAFDPDQFALRPPDREKLIALFRRLDFRSLAARIAQEAGGSAPAPSPSDEPRLISTIAEAKKLARALAGADELVLHAVAEGSTPLRSELLALALLAPEGPVVVSARPGGRSSLDILLAPFRPLLESAEVEKVGHDLKRTGLLLSRHGIALRGFAFDTMLAAYVVNPGRRTKDLDALAFEYLDAATEPGGGGVPGQLSLGEPSAPGAAARALRHITALRPRLTELLRDTDQEHLLRDLEMPLVPVLLDMEITGIALDTDVLAALSSRLGERIRELETEIYALAGEEFTISSPKQLRHILFEKLGLPPDKTRRTKTGYSTDAEVLAGLSEHEIVAKILEYREVTKLKSTYLDTLPKLVDPDTGRLHTSFNQAGTATGRLSSSDPNLQNIPIRTDLGMQIRRAFVPGHPGWVLLSGDFSQIELRILAHITGDENLIAVFQRDEDLHRAAAAEIFGVDPQEVSAQQRSFAKMVNFGIPYGISEFRLAREMGISIEEAHRYVQRYFNRFPRVREFVRETPRRARETGYVKTLLGRRRYLPGLKDRQAHRRAGAERAAVNAPIQGSAADIMKLGMLKAWDALHAENLRAKILLQVHDELLLEVPEEELAPTAAALREALSTAYQLVVPLKVDLKSGPNWLDMKPAA